MPPLVSIVIPVYNGADFLRDAIESALAQTYPRVEVVVVNDGSTDAGETEKLALSFGDRIRYFAKPNGHVASALNHGIANMAGQYFSWLSHDDLYYPHKIASQIAALARLDERTIVYGDFETLDVDTAARVPHRLPDIRPEHFRWFITVASAVHGCTLLIPRACFDECGVFNTTLRLTQDYDMWFRLAGRYRFVHVPDIVVTSRLHAGQDTYRLKGLALEEVNRQLTGFASSLTDDDLAGGRCGTPARAYGKLAASMQARGYLKARDATLALARTRLAEESGLHSLVTRASIAGRIYANALRPLARPAARLARSAMRRLRG